MTTTPPIRIGRPLVMGDFTPWPATDPNPTPEPTPTAPGPEQRAAAFEDATRRGTAPDAAPVDTPPAEPAATADPVVPRLSAFEATLGALASLGAVAVGVVGFAASFQSVSDAARSWGFTHPWMLPAAVDGAIPVFSIAYLLLIRLGMTAAWVRWVPWLLTAGTVILNISAGAALTARVAHGLMPLLWVVLSEVAAHVYRVRIGEATGTRMQRIRRSRWVLAPVATARLWRRMVLWETTSYSDALERERDRQMSRAALRRAYGRAWRWTAPVEDRVRLRLGELTPGTVMPAPSETVPPPETGHGAGTDREPEHAVPAAGSRQPSGTGTGNTKRDTDRDQNGTRSRTTSRPRSRTGSGKRPRTATTVMREFWDAERAAGRTPTGAELDAAAGTSGLGRKRRREWLNTEEPTAMPHLPTVSEGAAA